MEELDISLSPQDTCMADDRSSKENSPAPGLLLSLAQRGDSWWFLTACLPCLIPANASSRQQHSTGETAAIINI